MLPNVIKAAGRRQRIIPGTTLVGLLLLTGCGSGNGLVVLPSRKALQVGAWAKARGTLQNTGRGIGRGATGVLKAAYAVSPNLDGTSPALAADGTIYLVAHQWVGNSTWNDPLIALRADGTVKWKFTTAGQVGSVDPALAADGTVYIGSSDGYLYAIHPDGTLQWKYKTGGQIVRASPTIGADGTIYIGALDGYLYALGPDGTLQWRYNTNATILSCPAIGSDGTLYVQAVTTDQGPGGLSGLRGWLFALEANGALKWQYSLGVCNYEDDTAPAIGPDGTIYAASGDGALYALKPDGTLQWKYQADGSLDSSPAIASDGTVYIETSSSLDAVSTSGTLRWQAPIRSRIGNDGHPAIAADGMIYVFFADNSLHAISPSGAALWSVGLPPFHDPDPQSVATNAPVIAPDGTVYVASVDHLYMIH